MNKNGRDILKRLSRRQKNGLCVVALSLLIIMFLIVAVQILEGRLYDQKGAQRWSEDGEYAQISCFFPVSMQLDDYFFLNLYHTIEKELTEESIEPPNQEGARLFLDAYSVGGSIVISTDSYSMELQALGVSENFFLFHPVSLEKGAYLDEGMLMQDGILLDEDAAWQLFGSNDIVGMQVNIGSVPYYVRGVLKRDESHFAKAAGLDKSLCYVPMETMRKYGFFSGSFSYECILPNPVDGFALEKVKKAVEAQENTVEIIENSERFSVLSLIKNVKEFGIRSMSRKGIIYPYWENIARAYEDVFTLLLIIRLILYGLSLFLMIVYLSGRWRRRTWTVKSVWKRCYKTVIKKFQPVGIDGRKNKEAGKG